MSNGLKVLVKVDHRAPVVVTQVWYRVGSSYEHSGDTGLSHMLEHMMFKGTTRVGPGEFSRIISGLGGTYNAFTSRDYTAYYEMLSRQHLARALQLEADRMRNLTFDPKLFAREREVVGEERRLRTDDQPAGLLHEQLMAAAWRASPYHNPTIGWSDDLRHLQLSQVRNWYRRWYAPDNATLVVVGDVEPAHVLALARKYFGPIPRADVVSPRPILEPKQQGLTRVEVHVAAKQPMLIMGYKVPVFGHAREAWEPYALYVLAAVLDGGESSRLQQRLVRGQGLAAAVGVDYDGFSRLPTLLTLSGVPTVGHTTAQLERALRQQVKMLREQLVDPRELARVIAQAVADKIYRSDSMFHQATELGAVVSVGQDWHMLDREIAAIRAVTPEQVRTVARRYLVDDNLTIAELVPKRASRLVPGQSPPAPASVSSVSSAPVSVLPAAVKAGPARDAAPKPQSVQQSD